MSQAIRAFTVFNVVLYGSNLYLFIFIFGIANIKPLYFYLLTAGAAFMTWLLYSASSSFHVSRSLVSWLAAVTVYYLVMFFYSSQSDAVIQILTSYLEALALCLAFMALFRDAEFIQSIRIALFWVTMFAVVMNIYDFFEPSFSDTLGRASGLYINPNYSGFMLTIMMVSSIAVVPTRTRVLFCTAVGVAVLLTFSRGGWLLWAVAMGGLIAFGFITFRHRIAGVTASASLSVLFVYCIYSGMAIDFLKFISASDYIHPGSAARLIGLVSEDSLPDESTASRLQAASNAWVVFTEHPWFGAGLAHTREWDFGVSPHNMFLTMAAEGGMIGVGLLIWLYFLLWRTGNCAGKLITLLLVIYSFFSHNIMELPAIMMIISLVVCSGRNSKQLEELPSITTLKLTKNKT